MSRFTQSVINAQITNWKKKTVKFGKYSHCVQYIGHENMIHVSILFAHL